jgi:hypothetical protein
MHKYIVRPVASRLIYSVQYRYECISLKKRLNNQDELTAPHLLSEIESNFIIQPFNNNTLQLLQLHGTVHGSQELTDLGTPLSRPFGRNSRRRQLLLEVEGPHLKRRRVHGVVQKYQQTQIQPSNQRLSLSASPLKPQQQHGFLLDHPHPRNSTPLVFKNSLRIDSGSPNQGRLLY